MVTSGAITGQEIYHGTMIDLANFVLSAKPGDVLMVNKTKNIVWKQRHTTLNNNALYIAYLNSTIYWMAGNTSMMLIGALTTGGVHIFRHEINATFDSPDVYY